jgi:ferredoxin--NADP+ reductase
VVVVGNGNVALDVARMLAQPVESLERTETADCAIEALRGSSVEEVVVTARRGPQFAAYTTGELIGLDRVEGVNVSVLSEEVAEAMAGSPRLARLLQPAVDRSAAGTDRTITFRYGLVPVSINGHDKVESISFRRSDGSIEELEAGLVVRAIGYRGRSVDGLPFDDQAGTVPHVAGSVCDPESGEFLQGLYCSGWIKRGATGVIGTNKVDSAETVDSLLHDFVAGRLATPARDAEHLAALVRKRQPDLVTSDGWQHIDQAERKAGRRARRPRQKFVTVEELLAASRPA